jgi:DNA-binding CsgD family transcriptional regulator
MNSKSMPIQYKIDINPSYEWAEEAQALNISHRELEVFALVTEGYSNKEIAQILKIKHQSVKNHMHNFTSKLGVKNNAQALIIALNLKLIKARGKTEYKDVPVFEVTADKFIDGFRKVISGEIKYDGVSEKTIRFLKVFLKEHGIDPDNW